MDLESLLVAHLLGLEGALVQVHLKVLVVDQVLEDVLDVRNCRVLQAPHVFE